ncbi:MAG: hypothetical protein HS127_20555 [Planctomycetia bacterium]|nr:hypothetical protein [Planctomycetia bacterium]
MVESTYNWYWLVDGLHTANTGTPGKSCGDAAVLWHEVHTTILDSYWLAHMSD